MSVAPLAATASAPDGNNATAAATRAWRSVAASDGAITSATSIVMRSFNGRRETPA